MTTSGDEVSVVYDAADIRSLYGACRRCRRNLVLLSLAPLAFLLFDLMNGASGLALVPSVVGYLGAGLCIAAAFYFLVPYGQIWQRSRTGWAKPMTVALSDAGIITRHAAQDSRFHWSAIKNVVERGGWLFLFTTPSCAIILPRRIFDSDGQFNRWTRDALAYWNAASAAEHAE